MRAALALLLFLFFDGADPWPPSALIEPQQFAASLKSNPAVFYVGFPNLYSGAHIPGALLAGPASKPSGLDALRHAAEKLPRTQPVAIYCGCCPFDKCPNVRPAYRALKDLGFSQIRVVKIDTNLHTDWVTKGFPTARGVAAPVTVTARRLSTTPILGPQNDWTRLSLFNPTAVVMGSKTVLLFRAQDVRRISRIGYAESADGLHFTVRPRPVLAPEAPYEKGGGVEDPRVVQINGLYYLTYTGYDGHSAQLCLATSKDLLHWQRHGPIMPAYKGTWNNQWTKSGAILTEQVNGKWWMYYLGSRTDTDGKQRDYMGLATSPDLLHWTDATDKPVLDRRPGTFDERVMEPGPAPIMTKAGILLLYNGATEKLVYGPGWALFDKADPRRLLARSDSSFVAPEFDWEKTGTVPNVIFLEGALKRAGSMETQSKMQLTGYYGAADKYIGALDITIDLP